MEKTFWIDFVEGRISVDEMLHKIEENKNLVDWFGGIVSPDEKMYIVNNVVLNNGCDDAKIETMKFDLERYLQEQLKSRKTTLAKHLNIFSTISHIVIKAFPNENIKVDEKLKKKFDFILDSCPDYVGGNEADKLVDELYNENQDISKKQFKEKIKMLFNIEKGKYPRWIQSSEWPISASGKPMKFVRQVTDKSTQITKFVFEDVDTKQETIIEQYS